MIKLLYNKKLATKLQVESLSLTLVSSLMIEPIILAVQIWYLTSFDFGWNEFWRGGVAGVLQGLGFLTLCMAVSLGFAGPASALINL